MKETKEQRVLVSSWLLPASWWLWLRAVCCFYAFGFVFWGVLHQPLSFLLYLTHWALLLSAFYFFAGALLLAKVHFADERQLQAFKRSIGKQPDFSFHAFGETEVSRSEFGSFSHNGSVDKQTDPFELSASEQLECVILNQQKKTELWFGRFEALQTAAGCFQFVVCVSFWLLLGDRNGSHSFVSANTHAVIFALTTMDALLCANQWPSFFNLLKCTLPLAALYACVSVVFCLSTGGHVYYAVLDWSKYPKRSLTTALFCGIGLLVAHGLLAATKCILLWAVHRVKQRWTPPKLGRKSSSRRETAVDREHGSDNVISVTPRRNSVIALQSVAESFSEASIDDLDLDLDLDSMDVL